MNDQVVQPITRHKLRRKLGKLFYRTKRKLSYFKSKKNWAQVGPLPEDRNTVMEHRSMILRPLKDVDMYLQENKRTNLALAIKHINGVHLKPGEVFSFWKLVGNPSKQKGYLEGLVLNQGKIDRDTGGGLCQLGNLIFWMVIHSPLVLLKGTVMGLMFFQM